MKQYFTCPHCKRIYNVCKITRRGLELREKIGVASEAGDARAVVGLRAKMREQVMRLWG